MKNGTDTQVSVPKLSRLFVYGIFLDEHMRDAYFMSDPHYAVVPHYTTVNVGGSIVEAVPTIKETDCGLTGLLVEVAPRRPEGTDNWQRLDQLEHGYDRKIVTTLDGVQAWMYVAMGF